MKHSIYKLHQSLLRYTAYKRTAEVFARTPKYAAHWYVLLILASVATLVSVAIAWFTFSNVTAELNDEDLSTGNASTIKRNDLQKTIETYRTKTIEFNQTQAELPAIVDPGR